MEGKARTMAQKRARHYDHTKTLVAVALIVIGVVCAFVLVILYPQYFMVTIFNSRLLRRLIIDDEDYYTCSRDFVKFVVDEPTDDYSMLMFYVFSVSNAADVLQRGYKPSVQEEGPYGYVKNTYKYDILFNSNDSTTVSYKEYNYLIEVTDPDACEDMFFRLGRDFLKADPCANGACKCKNADTSMIIVNPLFLRTMWEDSPHEMLAHYSIDVFTAVKALLEEPFTEAVKAHLVADGFREVYKFRVQVQTAVAMLTAFTELTKKYTPAYIANHSIVESSCNLAQYGISGCPFNPFSYHPLSKYAGSPTIDFPSILPLLDANNNISFFHMDYGMPGWLGIAWHLGVMEFNANLGYTMVNHAEMEEVFQFYVRELCRLAFQTTTFTTKQINGCDEIVRSMADFINDLWVFPYSVVKTNLQSIVLTEFVESSDAVACDPLGRKCVWQWGFMVKQHGAKYNMPTVISSSLIDAGAEVSTNPNSLYKDVHAPSWYNTFLYREKIYYPETDFKLVCTNYGSTIQDAELAKPAGLWGTEIGISTVNTTDLFLRYNRIPESTRNVYFFLAMNISYLIHHVYRTESDFHDLFVIKYLNKYKDPDFTHEFTVGKWDELGFAQWAGGFVTHALVGVRTTKQIVRDGMWRFGEEKYYQYYLEFASWAVLQGYPFAWIYDVEEARTLLNALARDDDIGVAFRRHILYVGSTFIGDGIHFENGVGDYGDVTFTREANMGNFSCTGPNQDACRILDHFVNSSAEQCGVVGALYDTCIKQFTFANDKWINGATCGEFETSSTSPSLGIQCDSGFIFGHAHPYKKSRGNVVFQMIYSLTLVTGLQEGLWCSSASNCDFTWGGMFTVATPRQLLFTGYTEPSLMKYMDLKYGKYNVSFECVHAPYDYCGRKNYNCDATYGINMLLPNNNKYLMRYNATQHDEYFVPEFYVTYDGEMLWPNSMNTTLAVESQERIETELRLSQSYVDDDDFTEKFNASRRGVIAVRNFYWTAFPAWTDQSIAFQKYFQCQKRILSGRPYKFNSCTNLLRTGRDLMNRTLNVDSFYGNDTLYPFSAAQGGYDVNGSITLNQYEMHLWEGFKSYPYDYDGRSAGNKHYLQDEVTMFNAIFDHTMVLSQKTLIYTFQKDIEVSVPFPRTTSTSTSTSSEADGLSEKVTKTAPLSTRRFVEDIYTWNQYRRLGQPVDSYGMNFSVPIGMASLISVSDFPLFAETPHSYGNKEWGGMEYTFVSGYDPNLNGQRTFADYDPVTGKLIRAALRQQVSVRIEASAIFPNAFSSQQRCIVPTKSFALGSGFGCFSYVPIFWFEEGRLVDKKTFFQLYDHFYTRPLRANVLTTAGITLGALFVVSGFFLLVNETYFRKRFNARVYVD